MKITIFLRAQLIIWKTLCRALVEFNRSIKGKAESQLMEVFLRCEVERERTAAPSDMAGVTSSSITYVFNTISADQYNLQHDIFTFRRQMLMFDWIKRWDISKRLYSNTFPKMKHMCFNRFLLLLKDILWRHLYSLTSPGLSLLDLLDL